MSKKIIVLAKVSDVGIYDPDKFEVVERKAIEDDPCFGCVNYDKCHCGEGIICSDFDNKSHFIQRTCGNCGWHREGHSRADSRCNLLPRGKINKVCYDYHFTPLKEVVKRFCDSWKPISEPVCAECGGTGKVLCGCHLKEEFICRACQGKPEKTEINNLSPPCGEHNPNTATTTGKPEEGE